MSEIAATLLYTHARPLHHVWPNTAASIAELTQCTPVCPPLVLALPAAIHRYYDEDDEESSPGGSEIYSRNRNVDARTSYFAITDFAIGCE